VSHQRTLIALHLVFFGQIKKFLRLREDFLLQVWTYAMSCELEEAFLETCLTDIVD
jgi:hypothetical protein